MKKLIKYFIIFTLIVFTSCNTPKYKVGDTIYAYNIKMIITNVYTFGGNGVGFKGINYNCRYVNSLGKIEQIRIYEKEIQNHK